MADPGGSVPLPTGLPYGERQRLEEAQQSVSPAPQDVGLADLPPGPSINRPSEAPNESLFEGSSVGPGAGPESLVYPEQPPSFDDVILAEFIPTLEGVIAGRRNTTMAARQYLRKMRSQAKHRPEG